MSKKKIHQSFLLKLFLFKEFIINNKILFFLIKKKKKIKKNMIDFKKKGFIYQYYKASSLFPVLELRSGGA